MNKTPAYSINDDDMHWQISCPDCNYSYEYEGFFDSSEPYKCNKCGCEFKASYMEIGNGDRVL